jgi:hypothetical protein
MSIKNITQLITLKDTPKIQKFSQSIITTKHSKTNPIVSLTKNLNSPITSRWFIKEIAKYAFTNHPKIR